MRARSRDRKRRRHKSEKRAARSKRPNRPALHRRIVLGTGIGYSISVVPLSQIRKAYESMTEKYPPLLNLQQAAEIANLAPSTLRRKVSEGFFKRSARRGKPLRFWREYFIQDLMKDQ